MKPFAVKITIQGPITIEAELDEVAFARILQSLPINSVAQAASVERDSGEQPVHSPIDNAKSWDNLPVAKMDIKRLYREVVPVGRVLLNYIAEHHRDGCSFDEMKRDLAGEGDIQRKMNTIFLTARRMRYVNKDNKGMPPWETDYRNGKPLYHMSEALAEVVLSLRALSEES